MMQRLARIIRHRSFELDAEQVCSVMILVDCNLQLVHICSISDTAILAASEPNTKTSTVAIGIASFEVAAFVLGVIFYYRNG